MLTGSSSPLEEEDLRLSWFYYFGRWVVRLLLLVFARCEVKGTENVPPSGSLIVIANHLHNADPPILGAAIPRPIHFMAKEELFRSWPGRYFVRSLGAFPVRRGGRDRRALATAQAVLKHGMALAMFPEGTRSKTAQLQPAFLGSAMVALQSGAPVLPVGITGSEKLRAGLFHRPRVVVNIGRPFTLPPAGPVPSRSVLQEATETMMRNIAGLLPPEYRGAYGKDADAAH